MVNAYCLVYDLLQYHSDGLKPGIPMFLFNTVQPKWDTKPLDDLCHNNSAFFILHLSNWKKLNFTPGS